MKDDLLRGELNISDILDQPLVNTGFTHSTQTIYKRCGEYAVCYKHPTQGWICEECCELSEEEIE